MNMTYPRQTTLLVMAFVLGATNVSGQEPPVYKLKDNLPAMTFTFSDLEKFLRDLQQLRLSAKPTNHPTASCSYEISGPKASVIGPSIESIMNQERLGPYATEFRLSCLGSPESISISLNDFPSWEIGGTEWLQLISLRNHIEEFGREHKTYLGGWLLQLGVFLMASFLIWFVLPSVISKRFPGWSDRAGLFFLYWLFGAGLLGALGFSGVPTRLFPTIAIYRGTPNFMERYAPEISFLGLILPFFLMLPFRRWWQNCVQVLGRPTN